MVKANERWFPSSRFQAISTAIRLLQNEAFIAFIRGWRAIIAVFIIFLISVQLLMRYNGLFFRGSQQNKEKAGVNNQARYINASHPLAHQVAALGLIQKYCLG